MIVGLSTAAMMPAFVTEFRWFYAETATFYEVVIRESAITGERTRIVREVTRLYLSLFSANPTWITWVPLAVISGPLLAVFARRLHDLGRPAWWLAVALFLIFDLEWVSTSLIVVLGQYSLLLGSLLLFLLGIPTLIVSLAAIAVMFLWTVNEGDPVANEYGPVPNGIFR